MLETLRRAPKWLWTAVVLAAVVVGVFAWIVELQKSDIATTKALAEVETPYFQSYHNAEDQYYACHVALRVGMDYRAAKYLADLERGPPGKEMVKLHLPRDRQRMEQVCGRW